MTPRQITVGDQNAVIIHAAQVALGRVNEETPHLFVSPEGVPMAVRRDGDRVLREPLNHGSMHVELAHAADWVRWKNDTDVVNADVPSWVVRAMLSRPGPHLPRLNRVAAAPFFCRRPDGRIELVCEDGYDAETGTLLALPEVLQGREWPTTATRFQAEDAVERLMQDWLGDFPFAHESDVAHMLCMLLLPLVRPLIRGPTPMHLTSAPLRGTGKSKLAELTMLIYTGDARATTFPSQAEEVRKKITSLLLGRPPIILFDNMDHHLSSAELASALTATNWEDRRLGASEMLTLPNETMWIVSGQNPVASDELARRIIDITLFPTHTRPHERQDFRIENIEDWTQRHRGELLSDLVLLVQWWVAAGCPQGHKTLGSFGDWSRVVGGIVEAAGVPGWLQTPPDRRAAGQEEDPWDALLHLWASMCPQRTFTARSLLEWMATLEPVGWDQMGLSEKPSNVAVGRNMANKNGIPLELDGKRYRMVVGRMVGERRNTNGYRLVPLD